MAINTTNYNLVKPEQTDAYNVDVFNSNIDIIDAIMKLNERSYERVKLDVSTSTATSLTAWSNLSPGVKWSQGYMLSDKSLCVQWYGAWGGTVRSALMSMYIKSSGAGDVTFYMANIDNTSYVYDVIAPNIPVTPIATKTDKGLVTIPAFTGVKNIQILTNNTGEDISCNFGGLVNAILCDESEYTG